MATSPRPKNFNARWFTAAGASGDDMRIRYGRVDQHGAVEWIFFEHDEHDGIGAFGRLLRDNGACIPQLPTTPHHQRGLIRLCWRYQSANRRRRKNWASQGLTCCSRTDWNPDCLTSNHNRTNDHQAVAWHLLTSEETKQVIAHARANHVSVNSWLLSHLDRAVRPHIRRPEGVLPYMIPVNMRGVQQFAEDTENHVSAVTAYVAPQDDVATTHTQIHQALQRGDHYVHATILKLGKLLNHRQKVKILERDRRKPQGTIAAFSNLGQWDVSPDNDVAGWAFCPPVAPGQLFACGCITFGQRMGLCLQGHPRGHDLHDMVPRWLNDWQHRAIHGTTSEPVDG